MKILLLISGLLFSGGLFADMDNICGADYTTEINFIQKQCERNNILMLTNIPANFVNKTIAKWCRHDREISYVPIGISMNLTCVLYSNEPREEVE